MKKVTNVLLIYDIFIPSVRLCGYEQMKYLQEIKRINFIASDAKKVSESQCKWADVVIFARSSTWLEFQMLKKLKKQGKYIVYVLDDDVFEVPKASMVYAYFQMPSIRKRVMRNIALCDVFVSPSRHLLEKYGRGKKVRIEEPSVLDFDLSEKRKTEKFRIGFAGSMDRNGDVENILEGAISKFYYKYKDRVEIVFMGAKPEFVEKLGLEYIPYQENYETYQKVLKEQNWSVGLAPMPDTEFHRGKHYNKYVEYASVGCVGIYSMVKPYTYQIKDKVNGIFCENTEEGWFWAMEWCLEYKDAVEEIRKNMKMEVQEQFTVKATSEKFAEDLPEVVTYKAGKIGRIPVKLYQKASWLVRGLEFARRNGMKVPGKILKKLQKK